MSCAEGATGQETSVSASASGMIGHADMINAKPDGYRLAVVFAEIVIVPHLGLTKLSYEDSCPFGTWRGLGAPRGIAPDVYATLVDATRKSAAEPLLREALERLSMGYAYADAETFRATMKRDNDFCKQLVTKLNIKA